MPFNVTIKWITTWEDPFGKSRLKSVLVLASFLVAACTFGDDAAMRQAKQQCQARDLAPASAAYDACVHQISEAIYIRWGRDRREAPPG